MVRKMCSSRTQTPCVSCLLRNCCIGFTIAQKHCPGVGLPLLCSSVAYETKTMQKEKRCHHVSHPQCVVLCTDRWLILATPCQHSQKEARTGLQLYECSMIRLRVLGPLPSTVQQIGGMLLIGPLVSLFASLFWGGGKLLEWWEKLRYLISWNCRKVVNIRDASHCSCSLTRLY